MNELTSFNGAGLIKNNALNVGGVNRFSSAVFYDGPIDILKLSREHNNANILSIGARFISAEKVHTIIDIWLGEAFAGGRHEKRIKKLDDL